MPSEPEQSTPEGIWQQILSESTTAEDVTIEGRTLLVFGDRNCGKTTLLSVLKGTDLHKDAKGLAIDYTFLDVREDDDVLTRINVWQLEGEKDHQSLLKFAVNEENFHKSVAVIVLDFSQPWNLASSLETWIEVLVKHVKSLKIPRAQKETLQEDLLRRFQTYKEPDPQKKKNKKIIEFKRSEAPLEELPPLEDNNALSENLGIPIIVVCCKTDLISSLSRNYNFRDDDFEYIQQYLRRVCLKYGAALIYTSSRDKNASNCELFQEYFEHLLFNFDFVHQPQLVDKETVFIPIGWDSSDKIDLEQQTSGIDSLTPFSEMIPKPASVAQQESIPELIEAEDDQTFLEKQKSTMDLKDQVKKKKDSQFPSSVLSSPHPPLPQSPALPVDIEKIKTRELLEQLSPSKPNASTPSTPKPILPSGLSASPSLNAETVGNDQIHSFFQNLLRKD